MSKIGRQGEKQCTEEKVYQKYGKPDTLSAEEINVLVLKLLNCTAVCVDTTTRFKTAFSSSGSIGKTTTPCKTAGMEEEMHHT